MLNRFATAASVALIAASISGCGSLLKDEDQKKDENNEDPIETAVYQDLKINVLEKSADIEVTAASTYYELNESGYLSVSVKNISNVIQCYVYLADLDIKDASGAAFHREERLYIAAPQTVGGAEFTGNNGCIEPGKEARGMKFIYSDFKKPASIDVASLDTSKGPDQYKLDTRIEVVSKSLESDALSVTLKNNSQEDLILDNLQEVYIYDSKGRPVMRELMDVANNYLKSGESITLKDQLLWPIENPKLIEIFPEYKSAK
jgi:hypothetical protein